MPDRAESATVLTLKILEIDFSPKFSEIGQYLTLFKMISVFSVCKEITIS
jgi:hypothetical protein